MENWLLPNNLTPKCVLIIALLVAAQLETMFFTIQTYKLPKLPSCIVLLS
jgi:hypothetical protein